MTDPRTAEEKRRAELLEGVERDIARRRVELSEKIDDIVDRIDPKANTPEEGLTGEDLDKLDELRREFDRLADAALDSFGPMINPEQLVPEVIDSRGPTYDPGQPIAGAGGEGDGGGVAGSGASSGAGSSGTDPQNPSEGDGHDGGEGSGGGGEALADDGDVVTGKRVSNRGDRGAMDAADFHAAVARRLRGVIDAADAVSAAARHIGGALGVEHGDDIVGGRNPFLPGGGHVGLPGTAGDPRTPGAVDPGEGDDPRHRP
jgi:hypothetical protein